MNISHY